MSYNYHQRKDSCSPVFREQGFSLIEVMVSLSILAMGMLALMSMQTGALRANYNNQNLIVAQHVAELAVEWVKTLSSDPSKLADLRDKLDRRSGISTSLPGGQEFQFNGLGALVAIDVPGVGVDYYRYIGRTLHRAQDPGRNDLARNYVVRIGVEHDYRQTLARCSATVYWEQDGETVSISVVFFVDRKV